MRTERESKGGSERERVRTERESERQGRLRAKERECGLRERKSEGERERVRTEGKREKESSCAYPPVAPRLAQVGAVVLTA